MRSCHSRALWLHVCVSWGAGGAATGYAEGREGQGLRVGAGDRHARNGGSAPESVPELIRKLELQVTETPKQSSLGPEGIYWLTYRRQRQQQKIQEGDQRQAGSKGCSWGSTSPASADRFPPRDPQTQPGAP